MTSSKPTTASDAALAEASEPSLANVVWTSLAGAHASFAQGSADARRYRPEYAPFAGARDYSANSVAALAHMLLPGERLTLFTNAKPVIPSGYDVVREATVLQMIGTHQPTSPHDARIVELGDEDVPDMLKLVERTEPGPFRERTHELGHFVGIREGGTLVAMAGERMKAGKYVELSAVCTDPDWRGRGLGTLLMNHLSFAMRARGETPFLHVFSTNTPALRLYGQLGFRLARTLHLTALMPTVIAR
ncbi:GNAT family N-acetyltransferase [Paraburkholderia sp. PREW-6R]|uniref:GNAT family N-acetyltransferase n=1 Tax=Paraburkholderia sp. PREW-6R TaxID=3141544 RepID=UPI0031F5BE5B